MSYQIINENFYRCEECGPLGLQLALQYNPSNGDYRLIEKNLLGTGSAIFYQNGTYFSDAIRDPDLFTGGDRNKITQKALDLSARIRGEVYKKYSGLGGRARPELKINDSAKPENQFLPPGVDNRFPGTQPPINLPLLTNPPGQGNLFDPGLTINVPFGLSDARERNKNSKLLTYPIDLLEQQQDTFRISRYKYTSPNRDVFSGSVNVGSILSGVPRGNAIFKEDIIGTVILPMPNSVKDQNSVDWQGDSMNALTTAATSLVSSKLGTSFATQAASFIAELARIPGASQIPQLAMFTRLASNSDMNDANVQANLKIALSSFLLKKSGFDVSPESILSRGSGVIPNSNVQLLFNNVMLREFGFSYKMSPRSSEEAGNVRRIIRFFKEGMAAKKITGTGTGSGPGFASLFLGTPDVFKLEYKSGNQNIKGVNKFKVCALQSCSINYTAENEWESYDDPSSPGQPVSITMQLLFKEIEPIYDTDYQATNFGLDQPSITSADDVGF
jgi:hypothetical protein